MSGIIRWKFGILCLDDATPRNFWDFINLFSPGGNEGAVQIAQGESKGEVIYLGYRWPTVFQASIHPASQVFTIIERRYSESVSLDEEKVYHNNYQMFALTLRTIVFLVAFVRLDVSSLRSLDFLCQVDQIDDYMRGRTSCHSIWRFRVADDLVSISFRQENGSALYEVSSSRYGWLETVEMPVNARQSLADHQGLRR